MNTELRLSTAIFLTALLVGWFVDRNAHLELERRAGEISLPLQAQPDTVEPYNALGELVARSEAAQFALQLKCDELACLLRQERIDTADVLALVREVEERSDEAPTSDCPGSPGGIDLIRIRRDQPEAPWIDAGKLTPAQWDVVVEAIKEQLEAIAGAYWEAQWEAEYNEIRRAELDAEMRADAWGEA